MFYYSCANSITLVQVLSSVKFGSFYGFPVSRKSAARADGQQVGRADGWGATLNAVPYGGPHNNISTQVQLQLCYSLLKRTR